MGPSSGVAVGASANGWGAALDRELLSLRDQLRDLRRHLHRFPEPSGEEFETARRLKEELEASGLFPRVVASGRGLILDAPGTSSEGGRVAIRGDIDALRIRDAKSAPYRSCREGVMHACGHDAHASMVLGAAVALHRIRECLPWPVPWRALFQPAEESALGAREMVAEGAVEGVRAVVALHVDPDRLVGRVGYRFGPFTARCEVLSATIRGRGGHGARPHDTIDPIAAAALFISAVYQQVPRACDTRDPVVVSFGTIRGGQAMNVIPDEVHLSGSIRTLSRATSQRVAEQIQQIARGIAACTGAHIASEVQFLVDAVVNDVEIGTACVEAAGEALGPAAVEPIPLPSMGSEDFAGYLDRVPGFMMRLGVASEGRPRHGLHTALFDIDEEALTVGASVLARCLVRLARPAP